MRSLLVIVSLTALDGCYSPSVPSGAPCEPTTSNCPSGQTCTQRGREFYCLRPGETIVEPDGGDGTTRDARTDSVPDGPIDRDNDTVNNDVDNCPDVANFKQVNDDGDPFGDACDPCPPYPDEAPPVDPDGDQVSGRCDPNPNLAGDRIVTFYTFASLPQDAAVTGTITLQPTGTGSVILSAPEGGSATLTVPEPSANNVTVMAEGRGISIALAVGSPNLATSGPLLRKSPGSDSGIHCAIVTDASSDTSLLLTNLSPLVAIATKNDYVATLNQPYFMSVTRDGTQYRCTSALVPLAVPTEIIGSYPLAQGQPRVGLRVQAGTVNFEWMLVLER